MDSGNLKHISIVPAKTSPQFRAIEQLARVIIPEVYGPYIAEEHNQFFITKFQTAEAIQAQIGEGFEYYLLNYGQQSVGYLGIRSTGEVLILGKLYVLSEHRGKGIGRVAMDFAIARANADRVTKIELVVNRKNVRAIDFYATYSFAITQDLIQSFENGHSIEDYKMTKMLATT